MADAALLVIRRPLVRVIVLRAVTVVFKQCSVAIVGGVLLCRCSLQSRLLPLCRCRLLKCHLPLLLCRCRLLLCRCRLMLLCRCRTNDT